MKKQEIGTDKVREIFGEVRPEIVYQDESRRVTLTVSEKGMFGSYSMVSFHKQGIKLIEDTHREILQGNFIGETLRKNQIPFERNELSTFVYRLPKSLHILFDTSAKDSFLKRVDINVEIGRASCRERVCQYV